MFGWEPGFSGANLKLSLWGLIGYLAPPKLPWALGVTDTRMARSLGLWEPDRSIVPWKITWGFRSLLRLLKVFSAQMDWGPVFIGDPLGTWS